jgi:hypothetical protein
MSNHFIAINRGFAGTKISDFTFGTSTSAGANFELRIADVDGQSKVMTDKDVIIALKAFKLALTSGQMWTNFPPL